MTLRLTRIDPDSTIVTKIVVLGKIPAKSSQMRIFGQRMRKSAAVKRYEIDFARQIKPHHRFLGTYDGLIEVKLEVVAVSRRQDSDSYPKIVFDCLQACGAIKNDNRIDKFEVRRSVDKKNPQVRIEISKLGDPEK